MDNQENRIINEKLNSLQGLPEGYNPNMLSKWEIIEAGLPKQEKKIAPLYKWMAAAAIINIIFFSVTNLFSDKQIEVGTQLSANKITSQIITIVLKEQTEKTIKLIQITNLTPNENIAINKKIINKNEIKKELIKIEIPVSNNANLSKTIPIEVITGTTLVAITQPEIIKPTKRKVFQKDFKDDVLTLGTSDKTATEHSVFKIQLNKKSLEENGQSSPALQWKKSL